MKHLSGLLFIIFMARAADAQEDNVGVAFLDSRCAHHFISLSLKRNISKLKNSFPFREIQVLDYRPDTLRMGLFNEGKQLTDLRFHDAAGGIFQSFLNETYANSLETKTLVVVIKDLWFSDIVYEHNATPSNLRSHIKFRVETYVKEKTGYVPLTYFDTLISSKKKVAMIAQFTIPDLISAFIDKIISINMYQANINLKRQLSFGAVDSFSNRAFTCPITTSDTLQKGVYASFDEFRNNNPSVFNYEIDKESDASMSLRLVDKEGKSYYSRRMWGYCDGRQSYVMMDGNLFPIINYGRARYVYGSKDYHVKKTAVPIFLLFPAAILVSAVPVSETVTRNLRFFKLDIQTGEIQ